jgi:hypothetical protein
MLNSFRHIGAIAAVAVAVGAGMIAATGTANAAFSDCPNNNLCLWQGSNGTGAIIFDGDGSVMHDNGGFFTSTDLQDGIQGFSSDNRTLGRFCTYNENQTAVTNSLNPQTAGNIASHVTFWVKQC